MAFSGKPVRDLGEEGRNNLTKMLSDLRETLTRHPTRYFALPGTASRSSFGFNNMATKSTCPGK